MNKNISVWWLVLEVVRLGGLRKSEKRLELRFKIRFEVDSEMPLHIIQGFSKAINPGTSYKEVKQKGCKFVQNLVLWMVLKWIGNA